MSPQFRTAWIPKFAAAMGAPEGWPHELVTLAARTAVIRLARSGRRQGHMSPAKVDAYIAENPEHVEAALRRFARASG